ncbi:hypothetical protein N7510_001475 [Penicillium lagena]|uniref:uncharacterized protein n=1 Tax=Penicillium lagena TaxID=94218 RepID=UPI0025421FDC|nr:uncharacterized protein N7510_001475 [Penicillium lagena]KAJ5625166.1 hypothetical protein N7510_001475 [Penicillium lagena]
MPSMIKFAVAALAVAAPLANAQTWTKCNPLTTTCPSDPGSTESNLNFDFTQASALDMWTTTAGTVNTGPNGAEFTIAKRGDAPTIQTSFYIFYGEVSVTMKAASGTGIVSSIVLESDDLDEIDWEALGGDTTQIETNYFGKGETGNYNRYTWAAVNTPQDEFNTYTVNWQKDSITFSINNNVVRTLTYAEASGGSQYPQTPMTVRIGIWAGGDPSNAPGTIEWAGGQTDYADCPFTMYIKDVSIVNSNPAKSYTYEGNSGSSDSIQINGATGGGSTGGSGSDTTTSSSTTTTTTTKSTTTTTKTTKTTMSTTTTLSRSKATGSGAGSSTSSRGSSTGSGSASGTATSSGASSSGGASSSTSSGSGSAPTTSHNAAVNMVANYMAPLGLLAVLSAFFQL